MLLNLSDLSSESLQSQIIRQVRAKILAGELETGYAMPSIRGLARQQKVSVITVQRAYEGLMREGLLLARRGKGFFVAPLNDLRKKEMALERLIDQVKIKIESALDEGLSPVEAQKAINEYFKNKERNRE